MSVRILLVYDAHGPQLEELAQAIGEGTSQVPGTQLVSTGVSAATRDDLIAADAIILGSPNWSGVSGQMKGWLDSQGDLWEEGKLVGKVGACFTTGRGRHSGLEFTLLSLIHWMLACGMIIVGLPWNHRMAVSGSYYGVTAAGPVQEDDLEQGRALGRRVAEMALRLSAGRAS